MFLQPKTCFLFLSLFLLIFHPCFSQQNALLQFKNSLTNCDPLYNWKDDGSNPCDPSNVWVGIICSYGKIDTINLSGMDLEGMPDVGALEAIDSLKALSLQNNAFYGPMPEINRLRSINAFYAGSNGFWGVIPSDFFQTLGSLNKLWLQNNNFSGQIPVSIGQLPNLKELHLEYNGFSGLIPTFVQPDIITSLDLSNNQLRGEIPKSLNSFNVEVFENNPDLCGPKLSKECKNPSTQPDRVEQASESRSSIPWVIMIVVLALLILIVFAAVNQVEEDDDNDDDRPMGKGGIKEVVVDIPTFTKKNISPSNAYNNINTANINSNSISNSTSSTTNSNQNVPSTSTSIKETKDVGKVMPQVVKPTDGMDDLVMVNEERGIFGLQDLMKATAEVLGNGALGSAYKAVLASGVCVVVKRVREMNQMTKEVFDVEMKKLANLKHQNILTPLAYHYKKEDKLLVSEYVSKGSLLYVLHGTYISKICTNQ